MRTELLRTNWENDCLTLWKRVSIKSANIPKCRVGRWKWWLHFKGKGRGKKNWLIATQSLLKYSAPFYAYGYYTYSFFFSNKKGKTPKKTKAKKRGWLETLSIKMKDVCLWWGYRNTPIIGGNLSNKRASNSHAI